MEYVPGRTLSQHIAGRPLPEKEIAIVGGDLAAALEEAHERGVIHRDLKPANIMVTPKGRVKVLDFGLVKLPGTAADSSRPTTQAGFRGFEGTPQYMAPEQARKVFDPRRDVYSLGVVLFQMATGRRPFDEPQSGRLSNAILHAPLTPPTTLQPGLNPELERIIVKCLERDPENRYQSAKEVVINLRRLGSLTTTHHAPPAARAAGVEDTGGTGTWRAGHRRRGWLLLDRATGRTIGLPPRPPGHRLDRRASQQGRRRRHPTSSSPMPSRTPFRRT